MLLREITSHVMPMDFDQIRKIWATCIGVINPPDKSNEHKHKTGNGVLFTYKPPHLRTPGRIVVKSKVLKTQATIRSRVPLVGRDREAAEDQYKKMQEILEAEGIPIA